MRALRISTGLVGEVGSETSVLTIAFKRPKRICDSSTRSGPRLRDTKEAQPRVSEKAGSMLATIA